MAKCLIVFVFSLAMLVFMANCEPFRPESVRLSGVENLSFETIQTASNKLEPEQLSTPQDEPNDVEHSPAKTQHKEPNEPEPPQNEPDTAEPNQVKPDRAEPPEIAPRVAKLPEVIPPRVEKVKVEPNQPKPQQDHPNEVKPLPRVSFYDKCAGILKKYVDEKGNVDYRTLKRKRLRLKRLLDEFDNLEPNEYKSWRKEDKMAFWINAYNIKMLDIMVRNYPIESSWLFRLMWPPTSIRHIPPVGVIGAAKWDGYKFMVMDEEFTLSLVERRFFLQEFNEPRVFFALSYASISGPPLRNEPYYGHKLYAQLDDQIKRFLSSHQGLRIDREGKSVYLSAIFQASWHGKVFIRKYATDKKFKERSPVDRAVLNFIINYIPKKDVSFLEIENYTIKYIKYDWRLNDASKK